jgi:ABC-type glycerol-3-phosphate transport system substrate-binding protein
MAQKAAKPPDIWGLDFNPIWPFWNTIAGTAGFRFLNPEGTKFQMESEPAVWATEFVNDLINKHRLAPKVGDLKEELFIPGKTVFELQGPYRMPNLRQANAPFVPIHLPIKTQRYAPNGGQNVSVFKQANKDLEAAAAKFAMWMASPASQVFVILATGGTDLPVSKSALEHPDLKAYAAKDKEYAVFLGELVYGDRIVPLPSGLGVYNKIQEILQEIWKGNKDVKGGLAEAQKIAQAQLDEDLKKAG